MKARSPIAIDKVEICTQTKSHLPQFIKIKSPSKNNRLTQHVFGSWELCHL